MRPIARSLAFAAVSALAALPAAGQFACPSWSNARIEFDFPVRALAVYDDGSGPSLYAAGEFRNAGGVSARHIARWDGTAWRDVGGGINGPVHALAVFDSGSGPVLYATGEFQTAGHVEASRIARWNGRFWSPCGRGLDRIGRSLAVHDDGSGPALFVGGDFIAADRRVALSIAKWDGFRWSSLMDGLNAPVRALATFDDGSGPALYAGGDFTASGPTPASRVARWDGVAWAPVALGINSTVRALAAFDDGSGARLYAGGDFTMAGLAGTGRIARFDGTAWSGVGSGFTGSVNALAAFHDGRSPALYAGGAFTALLDTSPALRVARWDGVRWAALAGGGTNDAVNALLPFDDGTGPALAAGGLFSTAGPERALRLALWRDPCTIALRGTVNAGMGAAAVTDVLFVNDGTGGLERRVRLTTFEPFNLLVAAPPSALGPAPFALYAWAGEPSVSTLRPLPFGLGTTCLPTPLSAGGPAPRAVWNNTGRASLGAPTRPSAPAPALVASRPTGLGRPIVFTLQAIVADRMSAGSRPASVSNGVIVEAR